MHRKWKRLNCRIKSSSNNKFRAFSFSWFLNRGTILEEAPWKSNSITSRLINYGIGDAIKWFFPRRIVPFAVVGLQLFISVFIVSKSSVRHPHTTGISKTCSNYSSAMSASWILDEHANRKERVLLSIIIVSFPPLIGKHAIKLISYTSSFAYKVLGTSTCTYRLYIFYFPTARHSIGTS